MMVCLRAWALITPFVCSSEMIRPESVSYLSSIGYWGHYRKSSVVSSVRRFRVAGHPDTGRILKGAKPAHLPVMQVNQVRIGHQSHDRKDVRAHGAADHANDRR
jgi:hypothetical protein